mgnify:CR=1 FL=1
MTKPHRNDAALSMIDISFRLLREGVGDFFDCVADAVGLVVGEVLVDGDAEDCAREFDGDWDSGLLVGEVAERGLLRQRLGVVDGGWDAFFVECGAEFISRAVECIEIDAAGVEVPRWV